MAKEKDECPHCGEPIDPDAAFCKSCGSDAETGWSPDIDYWSVELPEDEEEGEGDGEGGGRSEDRAPGAREQIRKLFGPSLVASSWLLFAVCGLSHFRPPALALIPAAYLAACAVFGLKISDRPGARASLRR